MTPDPPASDEHVRPPDPRDDTVMYRVVLPVLVPLTAVVTILVVAGSLSRILLASDKAVATTIALAAALGVLIVASLVVVRPIRTGELLAFTAISALALAGGGIYAATQGYAPVHGEEETVADGDGAAPAGGHSGGSLDVVAIDIGFGQTNMTTTAGTNDVRYVNEGEIPHTLVIEGVSGFKLSVASAGDVDTGTVTLDAGTYVFFCDVPGHREVGMEGTLTVS